MFRSGSVTHKTPLICKGAPLVKTISLGVDQPTWFSAQQDNGRNASSNPGESAPECRAPPPPPPPRLTERERLLHAVLDLVDERLEAAVPRQPHDVAQLLEVRVESR